MFIVLHKMQGHSLTEAAVSDNESGDSDSHSSKADVDENRYLFQLNT